MVDPATKRPITRYRGGTFVVLNYFGGRNCASTTCAGASWFSMICFTEASDMGAIESLHARYRRAVTVRGHFPTEQAALKCSYLVTRGLDPKGTGQARWVTRWKPALNGVAVTFAGRMPAAENL